MFLDIGLIISSVKGTGQTKIGFLARHTGLLDSRGASWSDFDICC